jgi:cytochrome c-type biogenesis protein
MTTLLSRYGKLLHYVEIAMGMVLIIVGIMLLLDVFEYIARFGFFLNLGL